MDCVEGRPQGPAEMEGRGMREVGNMAALLAGAVAHSFSCRLMYITVVSRGVVVLRPVLKPSIWLRC